MGQTESKLEDNEFLTEMDEKLLHYRKRLMTLVHNNEDTSQTIINLISLPVPISMKYACLDVKQLFSLNNKTVEELKRVPLALGILEKYGRHLLKPESARAEMWRSVKFSNPIYNERVNPLKGSSEIMKLMGYTMTVDDGVYFPEDLQPDPNSTLNLVCDLIIAKTEIELYLSGRHPQSSDIEQFLPEDTVANINDILHGTTRRSQPTVPIHRNKVQETDPIEKPSDDITAEPMCEICLCHKAEVYCEDCANKILCNTCDVKWHQHPRRQHEKKKRKTFDSNFVAQTQTRIAHQGPYGVSEVIQRKTNHPSMPVAKPPQASYFESSMKNEFDTDPSNMSPVNNRENIEDKLRRHHLKMKSYSEQSTKYQPVKFLANSSKNDSSSSFSRNDISYPPELRDSPVTPTSPNLALNISPTVTSLALNISPTVTRIENNATPSSQGKSKLLSKIMTLPNINLRKSKCEINIIAAEEEISEVDKDLNKILSQDDHFLQNEQFVSLTRKKSMLIREKMSMKEYLEELDSSTDTSSSILSHFHSTVKEKQEVPFEQTMIDHNVHNENWICVYCTYSNTPQVRVCNMCHKTHVQSPVSTAMEMHKLTDIPDPMVLKDVANQPDPMVLKDVGNKFNDLQDQVYLEKKAAHSLYNQQLQKSSACRPTSLVQTTNNPSIHSTTQSNSSALKSDTEDIIRENLPTLSARPTQLNMPSEPNNDVMPPLDIMRENLPTLSARPTQLTMPSEPNNDVMPPLDIMRENLPTLSARPTQLTMPSEPNNDVMPPFDIMRENLPNLIARPTQLNMPAEPYNDVMQKIDKKEPVSRASFQEIMKMNSEMKIQNEIKANGMKLFQIVKKADECGYDIEEVEVALAQLGDDSLQVIEWLDQNWQQYIDNVFEKIRSRTTNLVNDTIGELSIQEVKNALKKCKGNIDEAVQECLTKRQLLYSKFNLDESIPRDDVLYTMQECQGDSEKIEIKLNQIALQPFIERIWEGVDIVEYKNICNSVSNSVIERMSFQEIVRNSNLDKERRIRMVFMEGNLRSWGRAETVIKIIDEELSKLEMSTLEDVIEAVRNCAGFKTAVAYLQQECQICFTQFPMNKITSLNICQCKLCFECIKGHFEHCVKDMNVRRWSCPVCQRPNMSDHDTAQNYLSFLTILISTYCDQPTKDLFDKKANMWYIQQDVNFRWCAHCETGFIFQGEPNQLCMICPNCRQKTCFECKKEWEAQHANITCEEFEQWKYDNDPNNQALGLANHLKENGIDCPSCKMRYSLSKGGCMHFTCPQCSHEFCSGCCQPFYHENTCPFGCEGKGLHCHHPRDCFFYLRDLDPTTLQQLLQIHQKGFDKDVNESPANCPVMEQKETNHSSNYDEACGKEVKAGWAGLCIDHYKEYLVGLINKHNLDPLDVEQTEERLKIILTRLRVNDVKKKQNEKQAVYMARLKKIIQDKEPLKRNK